MGDPPSVDTDPQVDTVEDAAHGKPERPGPDEMGEWSFPASDPPATWTWDPVRKPRGA